MRGWLLGFADHFDKRTTTVVENEYGKGDEAPEDVKPVEDTPVKPGTVPTSTMGWPLPVAFDPIVTDMPESEQTSIESVGAYLAAHTPEKNHLVRALPASLATRLHYDDDALKLLEAHDYEHAPAQPAEAVFARRAGVCAGYARLMVALGKAAG